MFRPSQLLVFGVIGVALASKISSNLNQAGMSYETALLESSDNSISQHSEATKGRNLYIIIVYGWQDGHLANAVFTIETRF